MYIYIYIEAGDYLDVLARQRLSGRGARSPRLDWRLSPFSLSIYMYIYIYICVYIYIYKLCLRPDNT